MHIYPRQSGHMRVGLGPTLIKNAKCIDCAAKKRHQKMERMQTTQQVDALKVVHPTDPLHALQGPSHNLNNIKQPMDDRLSESPVEHPRPKHPSSYNILSNTNRAGRCKKQDLTVRRRLMRPLSEAASSNSSKKGTRRP